MYLKAWKKQREKQLFYHYLAQFKLSIDNHNKMFNIYSASGFSQYQEVLVTLKKCSYLPSKPIITFPATLCSSQEINEMEEEQP